MQSKLNKVREACEADLLTFIHTLAPYRVLGYVHEELITWWYRQNRKDNQLVLLPRAHQKSALIAFRVAYHLTKYPHTTILYVSATSDLAEAQLKIIKDIMSSEYYQTLWPDMIHPDEGKRERWTNAEIIVDHPNYKLEGVRDPSIKAAGLTTNITGFHADVVVLDDIVVPNNAYTEEGRNKVSALYAQLASIENPDSESWVVGTRYHPSDIYGKLIDMEEVENDEDGELVRSEKVYELYTKVVETEGEFVWPRERRKSDGAWFGFNAAILARKKAKYGVNVDHFFAQYYNDPNDPENQKIDRESFIYYDREAVTNDSGTWMVDHQPLELVSAMDFAFSLKRRADYSAIIVLGTNPDGLHYILDLSRFKTNKISGYFDKLVDLYNKWGFKRIRMEVTVAQAALVKELKTQYIERRGMALSIDEYRPSRHEGTKLERIDSTLQPLYENHMILHYRGGNCSLLEDELVSAHPEHDDLKDVLTAAVSIARAPVKKRNRRKRNVIYDNRFGGIAYR